MVGGMEDHLQLTPSPGTKMCYLIKRRDGVSREELIAHWFANHMPGVIASQATQAKDGGLHARRYEATLYDPKRSGASSWDGMAQLWFDQPPPELAEPHGTTPKDSFQERAEPYTPWATREFVIIDGATRLAVSPLTLNDPYPVTRSGFFKVTFLIGLKSGTDHDEFYRHWLSIHVSNAASVMNAVGGFRYVVSQSLDPQSAPYAGMAELYFKNELGWAQYRDAITADGTEQWVDAGSTVMLRAGTEMVGID